VSSLVRHGASETIANGLQYDNEFWQFSLLVYKQNEVAKECLALQETSGANINLLLFCAWAGAQGIVLSNENIEAASIAVAAWNETIVRPLRGVRQKIKSLGGGGLEEFRAFVKDIELEAEKIEQAILFDYSKSISGSPAGADRRDVITENIKKYVAFTSGAGDRHSPGRSAPYLIGAALRLRS
jgi:uncharacterized protein (TIGR02444 family)